jgi:hypothetical protein
VSVYRSTNERVGGWCYRDGHAEKERRIRRFRLSIYLVGTYEDEDESEIREEDEVDAEEDEEEEDEGEEDEEDKGALVVSWDGMLEDDAGAWLGFDEEDGEADGSGGDTDGVIDGCGSSDEL